MTKTSVIPEMWVARVSEMNGYTLVKYFTKGKDKTVLPNENVLFYVVEEEPQDSLDKLTESVRKEAERQDIKIDNL